MHHHHHTTILQLPNRATGHTHTTGAGPTGAGWATTPTVWGGRVGYRRVARQLGATAIHPHSWPTHTGPATGYGWVGPSQYTPTVPTPSL